jgi:hypothetical protein
MSEEREEFEKWAAQRGLNEWAGVGALKDWEVDRARALNIWTVAYAAGKRAGDRELVEALREAVEILTDEFGKKYHMKPEAIPNGWWEKAERVLAVHAEDIE